MTDSSSLSPADSDAVRDGCCDTLERCLGIVSQLTPEQFNQCGEGQSSIGAHLRHALEHVLAVCHWLDGDEGIGDHVCYDDRERNQDIETNPMHAKACIERCLTCLRGLDAAALAQPITISHIPRVNHAPVKAESTVARELFFLANHNVHHVALMKSAAQIFGIDLSDTNTLAFATQTHQDNQSCAQ